MAEKVTKVEVVNTLTAVLSYGRTAEKKGKIIPGKAIVLKPGKNSIEKSDLEYLLKNKGFRYAVEKGWIKEGNETVEKKDAYREFGVEAKKEEPKTDSKPEPKPVEKNAPRTEQKEEPKK
jgi:hypothetical protein